MLRLIPPPLHRALYRLAHVVRRCWLRLRGGTVYGCSVLGRDARGFVLMVRHSYGGRGWEVPGGARGRNEAPDAAAMREFREELGCEIEGLRHLGQVLLPFHGTTNAVDVFTGLVIGIPRVDRREIVEARFFSPEDLRARGGAKTRLLLDLLEQR